MPEEVKDCCFLINGRSIIGNIGDLENDFIGVLSLQSTTIADFHFGVLAGFHSIVNLEKSSIINGRGSAIRVVNPRIFKA